MPARSDLNPGDIPKLLPYLMIIDKNDDRLRWRLVGTAAVREIGRDPTGSIVGSYITGPGSAAAQKLEREELGGCDALSSAASVGRLTRGDSPQR
jgi:hypothetical protein